MIRIIEEDDGKKDGFDPTDNFKGKMVRPFPDDKDGDGKVNEAKLRESLQVVPGQGIDTVWADTARKLIDSAFSSAKGILPIRGDMVQLGNDIAVNVTFAIGAGADLSEFEGRGCVFTDKLSTALKIHRYSRQTMSINSNRLVTITYMFYV